MSTSTAHQQDFKAPAVVALWQRRAFIVGLVFLVPTIIGWVIEYDHFYQSYLLAYMYCMEATLGSLGLLMLYHLSGGAWGTVLRRTFEAAMTNLWLMLPLFAPLIIGFHHIYPWSRPEVVSKDPHLQHVYHYYLRMDLWLLRAGCYFGILLLLVWALNRISRRQDLEPIVVDRRLRGISGMGEVLYLFVTLFMYTDWMLSLTPHYISMVYGLIFNAGQGLAAICFAVIVAALLVRYPPMDEVIKPDQFLDNGKIMLTFVMVWGWWSYGQWIIFWSGNKPDEISWFLTRTHGNWNYWAFVDIIWYFCIPFALLLSRGFKSNSQRLMMLAVWLLVARYIDLYWYVIPAFPDRDHLHYSWLDAVVPICMFAFWVALFFRTLGRRPLLALHDDHVKVLLEEGHAFEQSRAS